MESDKEGASTTDGNVMEQSESGNTNDSDPEKGENRIDAVEELKTVNTIQELESIIPYAAWYVQPTANAEVGLPSANYC